MDRMTIGNALGCAAAELVDAAATAMQAKPEIDSEAVIAMHRHRLSPSFRFSTGAKR